MSINVLRCIRSINVFTISTLNLIPITLQIQNNRSTMETRVSLNLKNVFLRPGDLTPSAFRCEESKTSIARLQTLNLSDGTIGFLFWDFIRGNRPKMGLKCAIFKICPKLAQKRYLHETSAQSTIFGGVLGKF